MWCMEDARKRGLGHHEDLLDQIILAMKFAALHNSTVVCPRLTAIVVKRLLTNRC